MPQNAQTIINNFYIGPVTNQVSATNHLPDKSDQSDAATIPPPDNKWGAKLLLGIIVALIMWIVKSVLTPLLLPLLIFYMNAFLAEGLLTIGYCVAGYLLTPQLRKFFKYLGE
ncbi:hypothetical protein N7922_25000 (plasmid) [Kosakonia sp. ML.JS2a]|uniref:hypothetical protein n=1 Tax=Kosakonia sp. ML.JS2a TaxID=2980557 RepID=UPI0021D92F56|nr:hypothetical protein [Kosakonia sp. ML.JS2a]UXY13496.1 hypothetical protein N7922_25000 [Kosakonia sp. ML.JS2a]